MNSHGNGKLPYETYFTRQLLQYESALKFNELGELKLKP